MLKYPSYTSHLRIQLLRAFLSMAGKVPPAIKYAA
jgi:hypothetical protein